MERCLVKTIVGIQVELDHGEPTGRINPSRFLA